MVRKQPTGVGAAVQPVSVSRADVRQHSPSSEVRRNAQAADTDHSRPLAFAIADFLIETNATGFALRRALHAQFPGAKRYDFELALAIFATDVVVDLLIITAERDEARREVQASRAALARQGEPK